MASLARGEGPKVLSFAPSRRMNGRPLRRSIASGATKGTVAGRLAINRVIDGPAFTIISFLVSLGAEAPALRLGLGKEAPSYLGEPLSKGCMLTMRLGTPVRRQETVRATVLSQLNVRGVLAERALPNKPFL